MFNQNLVFWTKQTNTIEPLVSGRQKCEEFIEVAYGMWSLKRISPQDVASRRRSEYVHFLEENKLERFLS